jgi:hypothetical protein
LFQQRHAHPFALWICPAQAKANLSICHHQRLSLCLRRRYKKNQAGKCDKPSMYLVSHVYFSISQNDLIAANAVMAAGIIPSRFS